MRTKLLLVAALSCLLLNGSAHAQTVWTFSDINYPSAGDPTKINGIGYMEAEYSTQVYYWLYLSTSLTDTSTGAYDFMMRDNTCCGASYVWMDPTLPYDATHEYVTYMYPTIDPYFRREEDGALVDHYNYGTYLDGTPVLWPGAAGFYDFNGTGSENTIWSSILLGTLDSLFSGGVKHGTPDHLIVDDDTFDAGPCGNRKRHITYKMVDSQGKRVGRQTIKEIFGSFVTNTCSGDFPVPYACSNNYLPGGSYFTDNIATGCPGGGGPPDDPNCGFEINPEKWVWCPRDKPQVVLATLDYDVRWCCVSINGRSTAWEKGTQFYR